MLQRILHSPLRRSAFTLLVACSTFVHLYLYILSFEASVPNPQRRLLQRPHTLSVGRPTPPLSQDVPARVTNDGHRLAPAGLSDALHGKQLGTQVTCVCNGRYKLSSETINLQLEQNLPSTSKEAQSLNINACQELNQRAEFLPELIHIPFEEAVSEEVLQGWEDEWVSEGVFDAQKWGRLEEPKIDVVYTCKSFHDIAALLNGTDRGEWIGQVIPRLDETL